MPEHIRTQLKDRLSSKYGYIFNSSAFACLLIEEMIGEDLRSFTKFAEDAGKFGMPKKVDPIREQMIVASL